MMVGTPSMFYQWIFQTTDAVIHSYVTGTAESVIQAISGTAMTLFTIYVVLWGFAHLNNQINEPVMDAVKRMLRIAVILGLALNVGRYSSYVVNFFQETPVALSSVVARNGAPDDASATAKQLDAMLDKGFDLGDRAKAKAGVLNGDFGMYIVAFVCYLGTAVLTLFAAVMLMLSKFALAVLLAVGPIFLLMCMFESTKRFFELWLGQVVNFMLMFVLSVGVVSLLFGFIQDFLTQAVAHPEVSSFSSMVQLFIMCGIGVLVMRQVPAIASALGGGVALSTLGAFGALMGSTGGLGKGMWEAASFKSTRDLARHARTRSRAARYNDARQRAASSVGQMFRRTNTISM